MTVFKSTSLFPNSATKIVVIVCCYCLLSSSIRLFVGGGAFKYRKLMEGKAGRDVSAFVRQKVSSAKSLLEVNLALFSQETFSSVLVCVTQRLSEEHIAHLHSLSVFLFCPKCSLSPLSLSPLSLFSLSLSLFLSLSLSLSLSFSLSLSLSLSSLSLLTLSSVPLVLQT